MAVNKDSILRKLNEIEQRYIEIDKQIADPEISSNHNTLISLSKEQGKLRSVVSQYREYKKIAEAIAESQQIINDPDSDEEFKELAADELESIQGKDDDMLEDIQNELVMADDKAINSVIIEIRAGTGGDEAAIFAHDLYTMYIRYAETKRWKIEQLDFSATDRNGFREVIFSVKGSGVWSELGYESGGHRVQRVPETESQGRVHTSAATVAVLPEPEEIDVEINPADVLEHVSRAGGPGGQAVNKLNSAIKLEHVPTGITVSMRDEKSQHKNRAKAWRILRSRIYEKLEAEKRAERDSQRKSLIGSGDRSSKIRTYNFPQNRVTDHRINLSLYSLDKVMTGDMSEIVKALQQYDIQLRVENL